MSALKAWAAATGVKSVKTFAQALVALLGAHAVNVLTVSWGDYLAISAGAAVVCILHNVASLPGPDAAPAVVVGAESDVATDQSGDAA